MSDAVATLPPSNIGTREFDWDSWAMGPTAKAAGAWQSEKGFTFLDLIDVLNPLHHIPIISSIYPAITGDKIGLAPRLMGGALFGGPLGLLLGGLSAVFEDITGRDTVGHVVAMIRDVAGGSSKFEQMAGVDTGPASDASESPETVAPPVSETIAPRVVPVEPRAVAAPGAMLDRFVFFGPTAAAEAGQPPMDRLQQPRVIRNFDAAQARRVEAAAARPTSMAPSAPRSAAPAQASSPPATQQPGQASPDAVAQAMVRALDKYDALARAKRSESRAVSISE